MIFYNFICYYILSSYQESIVSTPIKDIPALKEGEGKDKLELSKNTVTAPIESEIKNEQDVLTVKDNVTEETSSTNDNNDSALKTQINGQDIKSNDEGTTIETENTNHKILECNENKLGDVSKENENHQLESSKLIKINDLELINNNKTTGELKPTEENNTNVLDLTETNKNSIIKQLDDIKNDNLAPSNIIENNNKNLNISEELKILDDAAKNSNSLNNSISENNFLVNGEISPVNCDNSKHSFDDTLVDHAVSDRDDKEMQSSINTLLSEDLKLNITEKSHCDNVPLITDSDDCNEHTTNEKVNGNVINQDSISNSSDSETIVSSECLQNEVNGDCVENSEQKAVAQPISVITIQTCDNVDSDCSEAYLTPNELNDTPKKILEKINLNANDHININDDTTMSQLNPSIESNEVENPSKIASDEIIEQKTDEDSIDNVEKNVVVEEENIDKAEANVEKAERNCVNEKESVGELTEAVNTTEENVNKVEEIADHSKTTKTIENFEETMVESTNDLNIVLQPHKEIKKKEGMLYL